jgi:hypothetical protein
MHWVAILETKVVISACMESDLRSPWLSSHMHVLDLFGQGGIATVQSSGFGKDFSSNPLETNS